MSHLLGNLFAARHELVQALHEVVHQPDAVALPNPPKTSLSLRSSSTQRR